MSRIATAIGAGLLIVGIIGCKSTAHPPRRSVGRRRYAGTYTSIQTIRETTNRGDSEWSRARRRIGELSLLQVTAPDYGSPARACV